MDTRTGKIYDESENVKKYYLFHFPDKRSLCRFIPIAGYDDDLEFLARQAFKIFAELVLAFSKKNKDFDFLKYEVEVNSMKKMYFTDFADKIFSKFVYTLTKEQYEEIHIAMESMYNEARLELRVSVSGFYRIQEKLEEALINGTNKFIEIYNEFFNRNVVDMNKTGET